MAVIHTYYDEADGSGLGLPEYLRSVFSYYVFCQMNNIIFYFNNEGHPYEVCFTRAMIPYEHIKDAKVLVDISEKEAKASPVSSVSAKTQEILETIKDNKDKNFIIKSNVYGFVPVASLKKYRDVFVSFLDISQLLKNNINRLMGSNVQYSCIHIRTGDKYMDRPVVKDDKRIAPDVDLLCSIKYLIENVIKDDKIILITDSNLLKQMCKEHISNKLIILDTNIFNTALVKKEINGFNYIAVVNSVIDTVSEFIILGLSSANYTITGPTGSSFSYVPSFLFNVPYYTLDRKILKIL